MKNRLDPGAKKGVYQRSGTELEPSTDECRWPKWGWPSAHEQKQISYIHLKAKEKTSGVNKCIMFLYSKSVGCARLTLSGRMQFIKPFEDTRDHECCSPRWTVLSGNVCLLREACSHVIHYWDNDAYWVLGNWEPLGQLQLQTRRTSFRLKLFYL